MRVLPPAIVLAAIVGGCSQPSTTPPPPSAMAAPAAAPAAAAPATTAASATSGECRATRSYTQNVGWHVRMTVSGASGAPCSFSTSYQAPGSRSGGYAVHSTDGSITAPPAHGNATLQFTATGSTAQYTPAPGYVGTDHFEARTLPGNFARWAVDVTVTK